MAVQNREKENLLLCIDRAWGICARQARQARRRLRRLEGVLALTTEEIKLQPDASVPAAEEPRPGETQLEALSRRLAAAQQEIRQYETKLFACDRAILALKKENAELTALCNKARELGFVPEAQNDMIFSIVCEELGVFGAILLLLMFGYLLYRLFMIAQNAPDLYGTLVVTGVFAHIAIQVILNLLVVLNMMPATGITLPFISYGGTSMMFLMTELGIALSVANSIRFKETVVVQEHEKNVLTNV